MEKLVIAEEPQTNPSGSSFGIYLVGDVIKFEYNGSWDPDDPESQKFIDLAIKIDDFRAAIEQSIKEGKATIANIGLEFVKLSNGELQFTERCLNSSLKIITDWRAEDILKQLDAAISRQG